MQRIALIICLVCTTPLLRAGDAAPAATVESAYARGLKYLLDNQNGNGSWGSFESARADEVYLGTVASYQAFGDGASALCVLALLQPARDNKQAAAAVEKAVKYFVHAPRLLRANADCLYNVWSHTYVLQAMSAVLQEEQFKHLHKDAAKLVKRNLEDLKEIQGAEGGFGYYDFDFAARHPTGHESTCFNNAAVLVAFHEAKKAGIKIPEVLEQNVIKSLLRMRLPDGAYTYGIYLLNSPRRFANRINGSLGRSQCCNLGLWLYRTEVTQDDLKKGLQNLLDNHHFIEIGKGRPIPHEAWYQTAGYYFMYGHYYAARCARELPADQRQQYLDKLADIMVRLQDADGSWWDFPLYGYYKAYGTAYGLMVLQMAAEKSAN